ncbi:MAG TPA: hypothetical protein DCE44_07750, partial [Verrucomicrobiales bacterium]|nr:hypothetical protein [Verrucomicrobiales bacterium]
MGVLAILAVMTWITADGVFRQAKERQRQYEAGRLAEIGSAFVRAVGRQRLIPAETNWAHLVAVELAEPTPRVS